MSIPKEKSKAQLELDEYRRTGVPYLSEEDNNEDVGGGMDFSNLGPMPETKSDETKSEDTDDKTDIA